VAGVAFGMRRRALALLPFAVVGSFPALAAVSVPVIAIEMSAPGQSAEWIAEEVALPFERALVRLAGLVGMNSVSSPSNCLIELRYGETPDSQTIEAARAVALSVWHELNASVSEPRVVVRESRLEYVGR
jgi:multidrug efflux pump subunit AcrB